MPNKNAEKRQIKMPKNTKQKCRKTPNQNAEQWQTVVLRRKHLCNNVM